jgi:3-deoxy-7-phosphoheptulonate synthase
MSADTKNPLEPVRQEISEIDTELLKLLARRRRCSNEIIRVKDELQSSVRDTAREEEILARLVEVGHTEGLDSFYVSRLFREVIEDSIRLQHQYLLGQQNRSGTTQQRKIIACSPSSHESCVNVAKKHYATALDTISFVECANTAEVFTTLTEGRADCAIVPIDDTIAGSNAEAYDLLLQSQLCIVGEEKHIVPVQEGSPERHIRYLILARKPIVVDERIPSKTSIVLSTEQHPGALVDALQVFKESNINLTKLESRPIFHNPWEEMFIIDLDGNTAQEHVKKALDEVTKQARFMKILGSYPSNDVRIDWEAKPLRSDSVEVSSQSAKLGKAKNETNPAPSPKSSKGYKIAGRDYKTDDTVIDVKGVRIGGDEFVIMAGPCSIESYDQIMDCAREVKERGGKILRGGCFKPRTSPYSFQGLGLEGLDMMVEAGKRYGLPIITEVLSTDMVEAVAEKSDMIQIGARNMQNFSLLSEVGKTHRPILLKRGMSASIDDLLHAVEYILAQGNQQVILCERGIRTFETATRSTLDLSAVPVLKQKTHLPVIVDPSHAAGERWLVPPLAYGAQAVGAHGIIVEIHPKPEEALSDGPQALRFPQFAEMMSNLLSAK